MKSSYSLRNPHSRQHVLDRGQRTSKQSLRLRTRDCLEASSLISRSSGRAKIAPRRENQNPASDSGYFKSITKAGVTVRTVARKHSLSSPSKNSTHTSADFFCQLFSSRWASVDERLFIVTAERFGLRVAELRIPGQGDRDSDVIPIRIPKLI